MLAPSEKHLENWILANPDAIVDVEEKYQVFQQLELPSGIPDLVFYGGISSGVSPIIIMELKKHAINAAALAQTLRYVRDVRAIARVALDILRHPLDLAMHIADPEIEAVLIGHSLESDKLLIPAELGNVEIMTYDYDSQSGQYLFDSYEKDYLDIETKYRYAIGPLGKAIEAAYFANIQHRADLHDGPTLSDMSRCIDIFLLQEKFGVKTFWEFMEERLAEQNGDEK